MDQKRYTTCFFLTEWKTKIQSIKTLDAHKGQKCIALNVDLRNEERLTINELTIHFNKLEDN